MKTVIGSVLLLTALAAGQWSEPSDVGVDTALRYVSDFQLCVVGGDTLWAFYGTDYRWPDTNYAFGHWSTGDSWSGPQVLAADTFVDCLEAGVDPQGRVWLSWYNGTHLVDGDTWGIYTRMHDASGWQPERLALPGPEGVMAFPAGQCFASDKHGNWYMGICEAHEPFPDLYTSALYSRFQGDTWIWPRTIAKGYGSPAYIDFGLPLLVARPDTGFWAVYGHSTHGLSEIRIDQVLPDSVIRLAHIAGGGYYVATSDSSGHLWVICTDASEALWSATYEGDSLVDQRVITTDRLWSPLMVCTDPLGWVWTCWTGADSAPVVSYNRGNGWSPAETVTAILSTPRDIACDQNGRIYVAFKDRHYRCLTSYRTSRPGIANEPELQVPGYKPAATILAGASGVRRLASSVVYDAMGRRVRDPKPGVYFVRGDGRRARDAGRMQKVVIQR